MNTVFLFILIPVTPAYGVTDYHLTPVEFQTIEQAQVWYRERIFHRNAVVAVSFEGEELWLKTTRPEETGGEFFICYYSHATLFCEKHTSLASARNGLSKAAVRDKDFNSPRLFVGKSIDVRDWPVANKPATEK